MDRGKPRLVITVIPGIPGPANWTGLTGKMDPDRFSPMALHLRFRLLRSMGGFEGILCSSATFCNGSDGKNSARIARERSFMKRFDRNRDRHEMQRSSG